MKKITIRWKEKKSLCHWEGTVKGDSSPLLFIEGRLCLTDLRESRASEIYKPPKSYSINNDINVGKQIASDLVNGLNLEIHEENRHKILKKESEFVSLMEKTDEFLKNLNKKL